jgi:hypothetical protein
MATFNLQKAHRGGNIVTGNVCLLKPVKCEYSGTSKKPPYYLNLLLKGRNEYLTSLYATNDANLFSGDYKDNLGIKPIVKVIFQDAGKSMQFKAAV